MRWLAWGCNQRQSLAVDLSTPRLPIRPLFFLPVYLGTVSVPATSMTLALSTDAYVFIAVLVGAFGLQLIWTWQALAFAAAHALPRSESIIHRLKGPARVFAILAIPCLIASTAYTVLIKPDLLPEQIPRWEAFAALPFLAFVLSFGGLIFLAARTICEAEGRRPRFGGAFTITFFELLYPVIGIFFIYPRLKKLGHR